MRIRLIVILPLVLLVSFFLCFQQCRTGPGKPAILVFKKAEFYFHEGTPAAVEALQQFCRDNGIKMDVTDEGESFTDDNLRKYVAVIFLNTAGDVLNPEQEKAFKKYIHAGGGFAGIHTAIDTEHGWPWYGKLVGAHFESQSEVVTATVKVEDHNHPSTNFPDSSVVIKDEWFNLKEVSPAIHVLAMLDENSYKGGTMGKFHPVSWYQEFEGSRVFVTSMGHTKEIYKDSFFVKHLYGGIKYVMGDNKLPDYNKQFTRKDTAQNLNSTGFVKTSVVCNLYEPMQMGMFANGKIIFIERRGEIKLYDPKSGNTKSAGKLDVFTDQEEGLLGLAIDPKWEENHWIYLYYSPKDDKKAIRLSRFVFQNDLLVQSSEKILLKVETLIGSDLFHAAGSLQMDEEGFLYIATGDNSSHRTEIYTEIDERPGEEKHDAQKSASNSMDLRGKILRIKPLPDGSYLCPAGNLYVTKDIILPDGSYQNNNNPDFLKKIQGTLNPVALRTYNAYTNNSGISQNTTQNVVPLTDPVYSSVGRPEIFVMGVRNPYRISYDNRRSTLYWGDVGPDASFYDSLQGSEGYDEINAAKTAGFYGWPYFIGPNKPYRDINYETNEHGSFFNPLHPFNNSPNNKGAKYLPPACPPLIWYPFSSSKEFPLVANGSRCTMAGPTYYCDKYPAASRFPDRYNGNLIIYDWMRNWMMAVTLDSPGNYMRMEPLAKNLQLNRVIHMLIDKNGSLWILEYGMEWYSKNPDACLSRIDYVKDLAKPLAENGTEAKSPIQWDFYNKNRSFYQPGDVIPYKIRYTDPQYDGLVSESITIQYKETDLSAYQLAKGYRLSEKNTNEISSGQRLIDKSDCRSCHGVDKNINGPSFIDVANRYYKDKSAVATLSEKIINGGKGNWGDRIMIPHPQLTSADANEISKWILSLHKSSGQRIPKEGRYTFTASSPSNKQGLYVFNAAINDGRGETIIFRPNLQQAEKADSSSGTLRTYKQTIDGAAVLISELKNKDFIVFRNIDLSGIKLIEVAVQTAAQQNQTGGGTIELHLDGTEGTVLGSIVIPPATTSSSAAIEKITLAVDDTKWPKDQLFHDLFFVIKNDNAEAKPVLGADWVKFNFK